MTRRLDCLLSLQGVQQLATGSHRKRVRLVRLRHGLSTPAILHRIEEITPICWLHSRFQLRSFAIGFGRASQKPRAYRKRRYFVYGTAQGGVRVSIPTHAVEGLIEREHVKEKRQ